MTSAATPAASVATTTVRVYPLFECTTSMTVHMCMGMRGNTIVKWLVDSK